MTDFRVEFKKYGEYAGTYTGMVVFENGDSELFAFKLRDGMIQPFINLIAGELALSSTALVERLQMSLGLKVVAQGSGAIIAQQTQARLADAPK